MTDLPSQIRGYIDAVADPVPMPSVTATGGTPPRGRRGGRRSAVLALVGVVLVAIVGGLVVARAGDDTSSGASSSRRARSAAVGDHWDSYFGVDVCGEWLPPAPAFEKAAAHPKSVANAGIHSHGDRLIHVHPFVASEAGRHATIGRFFEYGGWALSANGIDLGKASEVSTPRQWSGPASAPTQTVWNAGDTCPFGPYQGQPIQLTWTVDGVPQVGNPAAHRPLGGESIAVYLMPANAPLPFPPDACDSLQHAQDFSAPAPLSHGSPCRRSGQSVTTRLVVPTRTMSAGSSTTAYVIIDNGTGAPLTSIGCGSPFQVALVSATYTPTIGWFLCATTITIPTGETTFPATMSGAYSDCTADPGSPGRACLPNREPPPLPAGRYQATFFQDSTSVPVPKPVPVTVT